MFRKVRCRWCSGRFEISDAGGLALECPYCGREAVSPRDPQPALAAGLSFYGIAILIASASCGVLSVEAAAAAVQGRASDFTPWGAAAPERHRLAFALIGLLSSGLMGLSAVLFLKAGLQPRGRGFTTLTAVGALIAGVALTGILYQLAQQPSR
jgi:hypothetical protein